MKYKVQVRDDVRLHLRQKLETQGMGIPEGIRGHLSRCIEDMNFNASKEDLAVIAIGEHTVDGAHGRFTLMRVPKYMELPDLPGDEDEAKKHMVVFKPGPNAAGQATTSASETKRVEIQKAATK